MRPVADLSIIEIAANVMSLLLKHLSPASRDSDGHAGHTKSIVVTLDASPSATISNL